MSIAFGHKGIFPGVMESILAAGHWAYQRDGAWLSSDDAAVQAIIDAWPATAAAAHHAQAVKVRARELILAFLPDWKQSNLNARQNELNRVRFERAWTAGEAAEVAALEALWGRAKAIRDASNAHEAALAALAAAGDWAALAAYDVTQGWPE